MDTRGGKEGGDRGHTGGGSGEKCRKKGRGLGPYSDCTFLNQCIIIILDKNQNFSNVLIWIGI